jgi:MFS family permease
VLGSWFQVKRAFEGQAGWFLFAYSLGSMADRVFEVFLLWSVAQSTHSNLPVSLTFVARFLPALIGGVGLYRALEKLGATPTMAVSQGAKMLPLGVLSVLLVRSNAVLVPLLLVAFITSLFSFSFDVSFQTALPRFVKPYNLEKANAAVQLLRQSSNLIAPIIAGVILSTLGETATLNMALGITGGACITAILGIRRASGANFARTKTPNPRFEPERSMATLLLQKPFVFAVILAILTANVVVATATTLMPRYTQVVLNGGPALYGVLNSGAAAGAIVGATLFGVWSTGKKTILLPGVWLMVGALALPLWGITQHTMVALLLVAFMSVAVINVSLAANVVLQRGLPEIQLGKAMTIKGMLVRIVVPGISLVAGLLADALGLQWALAMIGLFVLLLACLLLLLGINVAGTLSV